VSAPAPCGSNGSTSAVVVTLSPEAKLIYDVAFFEGVLLKKFISSMNFRKSVFLEQWLANLLFLRSHTIQ
jgi:hypothetical protein